MAMKFLEKHKTLEAAVDSAVNNHAKKSITIIESRGEFFVEDATTAVSVRNWERQWFGGMGQHANRALRNISN